MTEKQASRCLLLPGWQGSGPEHWQSRWARLHGDTLVEQDDWLWPRRGDWMARLEEVLLGEPEPVLLVAHSLGCHLVAAWSAWSRHTDRVQGALLVAPPDSDGPTLPPQLFGWRPAVRRALHFQACVAYSVDDPYSSVAASLGLAADWGAQARDLGPLGQVNSDSGLGDWPEGRELLQALRGPAD
jgi:predicted alpha/beta hydrolase family esterase